MKTLLITVAIATAMTLTACSNQRPHPAPAEEPQSVSTKKIEQSGSQATYRQHQAVDQQAMTQSSPQIDAQSMEPGILPLPVRAKAEHKIASDVAGLSYHEIQPAREITDRENYLYFDENGVKLASETPVSTFSIDVDTAAYSNIRRMLMREGRLPPKDAVKIEELVNYFSYDYASPDSLDAPFSVSTEIAPAPWNPDKHLLQIGLAGYQPDIKDRPQANLVFLIDVSGSMQDPDKLGLVKRSLNLLIEQMDHADRVALVVYAGAAGVVLDSTLVSEKRRIRNAINHLTAGGSTNGGAGIRLAYDIATEHLIKGGINRVIIASDGDMNVGTVNLEALKNLVEQNRQSGVSLTTLGFGSGNYNYALMEQLADIGNGNAAYIDSIREAQKVLVNEMQSTLLTIAKDVKIQVEFNPAVISEYRLIGYENRMLNREDFSNDKVDAGEIGAGHTVTALYEVVLTNSQENMISGLRYGSTTTMENNNINNELAYVRLRYKKPDEKNSIEFARPIYVDQIKPDMKRASQNLRFASAVAGFGQLLRGGKFTANWNFDQAIRLAISARGNDRHGYRSEFVSMAQLAKSYSAGQG